MKLKDLFNFQINEAPIVGDGDMTGDENIDIIKKPVPSISHYINLGNFVILKNTAINLYRIPNENNHVFGVIEDGTFYELGLISLEPQGNVLGYNNVYVVGRVVVADDARQNGLSTGLYRFLVLKLKMNLMCGELQFHGARKLWSKLSRQSDMAVDVIDVCAQKIIEKNAMLNHGPKDTDYDTKYYDTFPSDAKFECIRFVLRPK